MTNAGGEGQLRAEKVWGRRVKLNPCDVVDSVARQTTQGFKSQEVRRGLGVCAREVKGIALKTTIGFCRRYLNQSVCLIMRNFERL